MFNNRACSVDRKVVTFVHFTLGSIWRPSRGWRDPLGKRFERENESVPPVEMFHGFTERFAAAINEAATCQISACSDFSVPSPLFASTERKMSARGSANNSTALRRLMTEYKQLTSGGSPPLY